MNNENPVFGRKVFFVNPTLFIEHIIYEQLRDLEYEVYIISDYRIAKAVLSQYKDALCFIGIDSELSFSEWYNFIKSFSDDEKLSSIFIGIVSETAKPIDKEKFILNLKLPGGFVSIDKKAVGLFENFKGILDLNGAKGRRQYLRLSVKSDSVCGYFASKDKLFAIDVINISSVGLACVFKKNLDSFFVINSVIPNLSLTIARRSIVINCIVLKKNYSDDNNVTAVLLFTKDTPSNVKGYIKKFIYEAYDSEMNVILNQTPKDNTSYRLPDEYKDLPTVRSESDYEAEEENDTESNLGVLESPDAAELDEL
ncbi:MAG: hypothetical protein K5829_09215 [Treponema sp.]|nr:hypothetical protein [Treponema sp.]